MVKYLYGFTTHSIQSYIFQTNKLKEIAGASELVEQVCTEKFEGIIKGSTLKKEGYKLETDKYAIRFAAGNIRYLFQSEENCKEVVLKFPKLVLETAPGISISQAVVECESEPSFEDFEELEKRLSYQRNNPIRPMDLGYIAVNRSRRTGLPTVEKKKSSGETEFLDNATKHKQNVIDKKSSNRVNQAFFGNEVEDKNVPIDIEKIVSSKSPDYSWLAVIHADGNNMGMALQNLKNEITKDESYSTVSRKFSGIIDKSTKAAAQKAFEDTMKDEEPGDSDIVPFRPIIVGGDDLTIICRADLALKFTQVYLEEFEKQTIKNFKDAKLTTLSAGLSACAGIAFVKMNYPFHYAINLAETLCAHAKKISTGQLCREI